MIIGIPSETKLGEKRVAMAPDNVLAVVKKVLTYYLRLELA